MFGGKKKAEIIKHTRDPKYIDAKIEAEEKFPGDPLNQVEYLSDNYGPKFKVIRMLELAQFNLSINHKGNVELFAGTLDWFIRGALDAVDHMQDDLPDGVYQYIDKNISPVSKKIIEYKSK